MATIVSIRCSKCGEKFDVNATQLVQMGLKEFPKKCPKCLDEQQKRPDVTIARQELYSVVAKISSLPGQWEQVKEEERFKDDRLAWRMTIKGSKFGASWSGRIDIWATTEEPPKVGDIVTVVEMEVRKKVSKKRWERGTLEHGTVSGWEQIPMSEYKPDDSENFKIEEEVRRYIRLDPVPIENPGQRELVWVTAYSKTTLKGLGRQFHASLSGSPIWHKEIEGGARSGRFSTTGWLAVVDPDNPVFHSHTENGNTEKVRYPADLSEYE